MENKKEVIGDILIELEEADKLNVPLEDEGTYSITIDYGSFFTLLCC